MALPPQQTLPQLIREVLAPPREEAFIERVDGRWRPTSSTALLARAENLAAALRGAGIAEGDRIALIAHDCVDWIVCAFGTLLAGCVVVPIFPTQALDQTAYILDHSGARLVFVDTQDGLNRLRGIGALPRTILMNGSGGESLRAFEASGAALPRATASATPDDLAVLIYTSGTTGAPKGVMLSHDNIAFDARSSFEYGFIGIEKGDPMLSVLPYSHIYEHTIVYIYLLGQVDYSICHDPNELLKDLREVRPVSMTSVPRIFDRVLAGVVTTSLTYGGMQARLVPWALRVGREYAYARTFRGWVAIGLSLRYLVAKSLVLNKIRKRLGLDRIRFFTSGSAALHVDTAMTFLGMGLPIMEGYGLTETSPVATLSHLSANRYGAVGKAIPGVEVRIAEDGEVLVRGRNVMKGYYRDEAATAAAIKDGWLQTGDVGKLEDGFLFITDRKKEVFKTTGGKWIAPARVESAMRRSVFISQAMVVGDGRPHPIALINANWDLVRTALSLAPALTAEELAPRDDVQRFLAAEAQRATADLAPYEQIRKVVIVSQEFTVERGQLSPSMKIKRRVVERQYAHEIERAYAAAYPHTVLST